MRLRTSTVCLVLALLGCEKREPKADEPNSDEPKPASASGCDQAALARLAERLDSVERGERARVVSAGLPDACESLLPATTSFWLRQVAQPSSERVLAPDPAKDEALQKAKRLACPKLEELDAALQGDEPDYAQTTYKICDFQRYGLISIDEYSTHAGAGWLTWTTHALLLDAGTPPEVAGTITRAVLLFETGELGSALTLPSSGQKRLPKISGGTQIPEGLVVHASMRELSLDDQPIAALKDGVPSAEVVSHHAIAPLYEQLEQDAGKARLVAEANGEEWIGRMILDFDERIPFSTVVDAMYTGGRAGFTTYAFIVESDQPAQRALLVAPPQFGIPKSPPLKVFIADTGFIVAVPGETERRELPKRDAASSGPEAWDQPGLAAIVDEVQKADPELRKVVVSAENNIQLGVLLGTYATLAGPSCDQAKPHTCLLPDLVIEAGGG